MGGTRASMQAPAKVNLALTVLGRRADGYHDVRTLYQAVDFCDNIVVERGGQGIELEVDGPDLGPRDENLAYRAASAYALRTGGPADARILLTKVIPAGAGLGGGSSDAAAVLRCLAALHGDLDTDRLRSIGATLGSDVPFFLGDSPLAWGTGRGERLEPLPAAPPRDIVLCLTPVHVSTAGAYRALASARDAASTQRSAPAADGQAAAAGAAAPAERASSGEPRAARVAEWAEIEAVAHNDFEAVIAAGEPRVARTLEALRAAGASTVLMSGSGAAAFGLFPTSDAARAAAEELSRSLGWPCLATRTLEVLPEPLLR